MNEDGIVDYDPGDAPDPGSAAAHLLRTAAVNPQGEMQIVPVELIVPAPGQRQLSSTWVDKNVHMGWIDALGHGIVLNEVPIAEYVTRESAYMPDGSLRDEAEKALTWADENGYESVFEALIGQHRSELAKRCGLVEIEAYCLDNISASDCAQLFVQDARTTRPLRGYDVHQAALVYGEPRAKLIQAELDGRGIKLVPGAPKPNQVSCIRALEKACGDPATSAMAPDHALLTWYLDVLSETFPQFQWPDALVQGLIIRTTASDIAGADPKQLGKIAHKHWKGSIKLAVEAVRTMRKVTSAPNPQAAGDIWATLFAAAGIAPKAPKPTKAMVAKATAPAPAKATGTKATGTTRKTLRHKPKVTTP